MDSVWLLWFEREQNEGVDTELLIGVYRTEESAQAAMERVRDQPGFRDFPQGLSVHECVLDRDSWTEGFVLRKKPFRGSKQQVPFGNGNQKSKKLRWARMGA